MINNNITSKLPNVGTTIFTKMSSLANKEGAINLSQGFPNFPIDNKISDLVSKFMVKGYNQYAPMAGDIDLRQSIANQIHTNYSCNVNPDNEITITAGATQAIFTALASIINKEDEVIYFTPAYDCYAPTIELFGGVSIEIPLRSPHFSIDWEQVKCKISSKTKLIIINTPHNPTGSVLRKDDLKELEKIISQNDLYVLSDEVYEHITFDNEPHCSVLSSEILYNKSFVTFSFGKSLHVTGWKLGYCIAPPYLMKEFRKVHQFNVFSCNTPMQKAIAEYINKEHPFEQVKSLYQEKRDLFNNLLKDSSFTIVPSKGTYFQLLGYKNITNELDTEFAIRLTKEIGVASIPISVFYGDKQDDKLLRFCFAKTEETLIEAAKRLCTI